MTALEAFQQGMSDGWNGRRRQKNQGGIYLRSYRRGVEARARQDNGGEDTGLRPRKAVTA